MSEFEFKSWCEANQLKEATIETLKKEDLDSEEALNSSPQMIQTLWD